MNKEKILLTGGAGFIGSYLTKQLIDEGHEVVIYDAFIQYIHPFQTKYNDFFRFRFKDVINKVVIERGDTRDSNLLRKVIIKHRPDRIVHLAALPLADLSDKNSEESKSSIFDGTINVLEVLGEVNFVKKFVYISSSMIYGDFKQLPCPEDHLKKPKDLYGGFKFAGEVMTEAYCRRYNIPYSIVRPSAVYGPTDINRRVSGIFIENAINNKPIILHNGGNTSLDFTYVEDIAQGIRKVLMSKKAEGEAFNITYGRGYTLKEFADILKKYFSELEIQIEEASENDFRPKRGALDIKKARELVDYDPQYPLERGLGEYVKFFKENNLC